MMPIALPDFDDRTWEDLVEEGRSLIVAWAPEWTDHNASDPGITMMELFAFLTEALIYRTNRIPDRHKWAFLRLINGPTWRCRDSLEDCIRETVRRIPINHRAVTAADFETLATKVPGVARAWCLPGCELSRMDEPELPTPVSGHVGVLVAPDPRYPELAHDLLHTVRRALEPARLLGTRLHFRFPRFVPVRVCASLDIVPGATPADVRRWAKERLSRFFDAIEGGAEGG